VPRGAAVASTHRDAEKASSAPFQVPGDIHFLSRSEGRSFTRLSHTGILDLGEAVAGCGRRTVMANGNSVTKLMGAVLLCEFTGCVRVPPTPR
jgi:hypothetical protein